MGGAGVMRRGRGLDTLQGAASRPALHVRVGAHRLGCESAVSHGHEAPSSVRQLSMGMEHGVAGKVTELLQKPKAQHLAQLLEKPGEKILI